MTTSHDACYQNGMQQPAIILILRRSNPHHHTLAASSTKTTMSRISPTVSPTNGKQHAHLLREFYGIDGGTPEQQDSPTTLLSRQFDGAQSLFEVSARLADGKELLRDALSTITNEHATTKMTNITIIIIQKSVLPLMDIASDVSRTSANVVGPIAGGNYAHRREEVNRKKMIKSTKVTQKTGLVMVNEFVHGHSPPDKRVQLKRKVVSSDPLPAPALPVNEKEYGTGEFLGIIKCYPKGSGERRGLINKMMSPEYQYIKRSLRAVYNLITDHEKGRMFDFNEPWCYGGKPQIMNDEDVECFTESVRKNPGEKT